MLENDVILGRMSIINTIYQNIYDTDDDLIAWFLTYYPDEPSIMDLYDIACDDTAYKDFKKLADDILSRA